MVLSVNDLAETITFNGTGGSNLIGTALDDIYTGSGTNNTFNGLGGYDRAIRSGDLSNFTISGTAGTGGSALIESITTSNNGKKAVNTATPLDTLLNVESIQINGGASNNTINAGGGTTLGFTRTAFNGTFIANGGAGVDTITGGTYKNWLAGRGFAAGVTSGVETITGTTNTSGGAMDLFDLRNDALTGAAYVGGGANDYAKIANFNVGTDKLVLAGQAASYKFALNQTTSGGKVKTVTDEYWSVSTVGGDLIAQVRGNGIGTLNGFDATTAVIYGTGSPSGFGLGF